MRAARLELRGLCRRYGDLVALDGVSFTVEPGVMFGFVGPNGAGKTTTMRIILGVLTPDSGQVLLGGRVVDADVRRRFGYMPEERGLYPKMTVRDQLVYLARLHGYPATNARSAAERWIDRFGLTARADSRIEQLSLGNQQRVQLAAALVHEPELLVLDEPFSGVDPIGVDLLSEVLLEQAAEGTPVVFSSHQLELVERLCHSVAIINHGRVVATGSVDELRRRDGRRRFRITIDTQRDPFAGIDGVRIIAQQGPVRIVEADRVVDDQVLLDAARRAGPVHHFALDEPSLTELFREAVQ